MIKKSAILISVAMLLSVFLAGCNNSNSSTGQVSSESTDQFTEDYVYGTYVHDLDSYLNQYISSRKEMQDAFSENDKVLATGYANQSIGSLIKIKDMEVPAALKEKHEKLLGAVDIEIRIMECNKELVEFTGKTDSLTPDEQSAMDALNKKQIPLRGAKTLFSRFSFFLLLCFFKRVTIQYYTSNKKLFQFFCLF